MKLTYTILLAHLSWITGVIQAQNKTIVVPGNTIQLEVKTSWTVESEEESVLINMHPIKGNINVLELISYGPTLEDNYLVYAEKVIPNALENVKEIEKGSSIINGRKYLWLIFDSTNQGINLRQWFIISSFDNQFYSFLFTTSRKKFEGAQDEVLKLLQSVQLVDAKKGITGADPLLSKLFNKKWTLSSATEEGLPLTDRALYKHYFYIGDDGKIKFYYKTGELMLSGNYTYDSVSKTLRYRRETREEIMKIVSVSESLLKLEGLDYLKTSCNRTYKGTPEK